MKVLLINGSPNEHGCTDRALREIASTLTAEGVEAEIYWIGKKPVAGCIACGYCRKHGKCAFGEDGVNALAARRDEFDAIVVGSPVYYGGPSGQLTAFLDRFFYSVGSSSFAGKLGACVVSCRRGGATASFDRLNKYFTISSMPIVSSQYWNMVHGRVDTPAEVEQDGEGLQTMRTLARNMAWLLRCIEAGRREGIKFPAAEPRISTNFID